MENTIENLHQAAQYLAAAGISFIEKKADDSHTNLGWNKKENRMETHVFEKNFQLGLNLDTQSLEWLKKGDLTATVQLNKITHKEIVDWICEQTKQHNISKKFTYNFHYELPYDKITEGYSYSFSLDELKNISSRLTKSQDIFE
jgi:hypothetical protein